MYKRLKELLLFIVLLQVMGCKEPYDPGLESGLKDYLIVEGFINADGITKIQLSQSLRLAEMDIIKPENGAILSIEGNNNTVYPLAPDTSGVYKSDMLDLSPDSKYRLRIKTAAGGEYLSDYTEIKHSPDPEISWDQQDDGVRVYVSTSDPASQSKYYQWNYEETWEVRSIRRSLYEALPTAPLITIAARTAEAVNQLFVCWANTVSSNLLTASTVQLAEDKIDKFPLVFIPNGSDRLSARYSILVRQYTIPSEAYEFLELMKKNSEQTGSVFGPQPSTVRGNIQKIQGLDEPVVGYIYAAEPAEKRIYITSGEAGNWQSSLLCNESYVSDNISYIQDHFRYGFNVIADEVLNEKGSRIGWSTYPAACLDCRLRGGTVKPDFW